MPNAGYPDNDDTRTPSGRHDLGRQRVTMYPAENMSIPTTIADHVRDGGKINNRTDSMGDQPAPNCHWPVDGMASAGTAAYPPKPEDPNSRD